MVKDYAKLYLMKSIFYIFHHLMSLRTLRLSLDSNNDDHHTAVVCNCLPHHTVQI